jgi:hypothetical protein
MSAQYMIKNVMYRLPTKKSIPPSAGGGGEAHPTPLKTWG